MNPHQKRKVFKSINFEFQSVDPSLDVTEGDFSSGGVAWTLGAGWSIVGGMAVCNAGDGVSIYQDVSGIVPSGRLFNIEYKIYSCESGGCVVSFCGTYGKTYTSNGIKTETIRAGDEAEIVFSSSGDSNNFSIEYVTIYATNIFYLPYGTIMLEIRPQGTVQLKIDGDTVAADLTANEWSTQFHFNPDGVTSHYIEITNSTAGQVECHIHCLIDPDLNPDEGESA